LISGQIFIIGETTGVFDGRQCQTPDTAGSGGTAIVLITESVTNLTADEY
jgi:hypothetical protein